MRRRQRHSSGFTLIELMIVVAIIGILAAIAVPNFLRYQLKARSSEAAAHLKSIATTQNAYFSEHGTYVSAPTPVPSTPPGSERVPWQSGTPFDVIGWAPEGGVHFQYAVSADDGGGAGPLIRFTVEARGDLDGDSDPSFFAHVRPAPGVGGLDGILPGTTCVGTGVYAPNSGGPNIQNAPGPCDPQSGKSRF